MKTMKEEEARGLLCWRKLGHNSSVFNQNPNCEASLCTAWAPTHLGGGGPQFKREYEGTGRCSLLPKE